MREEASRKMTWVRVPKGEFDRIRKLASVRKAKREEKRKSLPWGAVPPLTAMLNAALKKTRRKKSPIEIAWDRNDQLWSEAVRIRDTRLYGPRCRICGQTAGSKGMRSLVGYHLVPKKRGAAIRWLLENGVQGCSHCNYGERMNPSKYRDKHIALVGLPMMEALEARARLTYHFTLEELLEIGRWLKAVIEAGRGKAPPAPLCLPAVV